MEMARSGNGLVCWKGNCLENHFVTGCESSKILITFLLTDTTFRNCNSIFKFPHFSPKCIFAVEKYRKQVALASVKYHQRLIEMARSGNGLVCWEENCLVNHFVTGCASFKIFNHFFIDGYNISKLLRYVKVSGFLPPNTF